jgi:hypothetical protein
MNVRLPGSEHRLDAGFAVLHTGNAPIILDAD